MFDVSFVVAIILNIATTSLLLFVISFAFSYLLSHKIIGMKMPAKMITKLLIFPVIITTIFLFVGFFISAFLDIFQIFPREISGLSPKIIFETTMQIIAIILFYILLRKKCVKEGLDAEKAKKFAEEVVKYTILIIILISFAISMLKGMM